MKRILVIDDDKLFQDSISFHLKQNNFDVVIADDAIKALEYMDKYKIDGVISDIMMPDVSGLSLLSLLKQFYFNKIPVIVISSLDKSHVESISLDLGAFCFLAKPLDYEELVSKINEMLNATPAVSL